MNYSNKALREIFYPFIVTVIIIVVACFFSNDICYDFIKLSDSGLGAFGTIFGFLIAILTIINSLDNQYIRRLKADNNFDLMQGYLKHAILFSFISIGFCSGFSFVFSQSKCCYYEIIGFILLAILVYSFLASFRFLVRFLKIIAD